MRPQLDVASALLSDRVGVLRKIRVAAMVGVLAGLTACTPNPAPGFRDGSVPITATTRFTPEGFAGEWHVIAAFPNVLLPGCADQQWQIDTATSSERLAILCSGAIAYDAPLLVDPRGVIQIRNGDLDRPDRALWIMWMDEDARTAVIGTPAGEMGWIVNRTPDLRPDRLAAAREIMAFNGYDLADLRKAAQ